MNPTVGDVHVNRPLTQISIAYMQAASGFIADRIFPNIGVQKQSDSYFRYDRADFWRNSFEKRAPSTESAGGGWKIDNTPTYYCHVWALHKDIADQIRSNADDPLNMDRDASLYLSQQALIAREVSWAANAFTTGVWTGISGSAADVTGVAASPSTNEKLQWSDNNSNPIEDVAYYADLQHVLTGVRPNVMAMGRQVWTKLKDHPDLVDRIKYTSGNSNPAIVTRQAVAALLELEEVMVMDGIQATSAENPAFETSKTTAFIAGKKALLAYVNRTPSILMPSAGYTFSWTGFMGAGALGQRIKQFRIEAIESDRVEGQMAYDQKVVATDCGTFFNNIVA